MGNIMIVGVGGQGTLLSSRILGNVFTSQGYDVKVSEVHGMSQRGGSVVTYVKYSSRVASPIIEKGEADIILAFEKLEALRSSEYLKKDGILIVNTQEIEPMPVITGAVSYPDEIISKLRAQGRNVLEIDALKFAEEAGNAKAINVVLIGALAKSTSIPKETWLEAIKQTVPAKFLEINLKAFELGYNN